MGFLKACAKMLRIGYGLPRVMSDSLQYDTPGKLTPRSMTTWEDWLSAVWYPGAQYDTPKKLTPRSLIPEFTSLEFSTLCNERRSI